MLAHCFRIGRQPEAVVLVALYFRFFGRIAEPRLLGNEVGIGYAHAKRAHLFDLTIKPLDFDLVEN